MLLYIWVCMHSYIRMYVHMSFNQRSKLEGCHGSSLTFHWWHPVQNASVLAHLLQQFRMRTYRVFRFLFHLAMASFWAVDSFAFRSTPSAPNKAIGRPSPTGPRGKLKAVVGDQPRMFLASGGDAARDQGLGGTALKKLLAFADTNSFLVGLFFALVTSKIYPSLGVDGGLLHPELFVGKYGVGMIFLLSGLSLQTSALAKAVSNVRLNGLIQISTFVLWPFVVGLPLRAFLTSVMPNLIPSALADGLLILTCLPTTVNMCIMLTSSVSVPIVNHSRIY